MLWLGALPAFAQAYEVPADYLAVEAAVASRLELCFDRAETAVADNDCGRAAYDHCIALAPDGETTTGLALCGGTVSNVLDRAMNDAWTIIREKFGADRFADVREAQRAWLAFRSAEARVEARRYPGGSMGAYSGWVRYNHVSADRLAYLRQLGREGY